MASPFAVRSFRFQWPADLATSWAFEMEALILGWYILATTGSVQQLVIVAALVWLGSLFSPFFGVAGDRIGHRTLLCITRGIYARFGGRLALNCFVIEGGEIAVGDEVRLVRGRACAPPAGSSEAPA